eukprot:1155862-Pelagomonas_calceolata.AAC.1
MDAGQCPGETVTFPESLWQRHPDLARHKSMDSCKSSAAVVGCTFVIFQILWATGWHPNPVA